MKHKVFVFRQLRLGHDFLAISLCGCIFSVRPLTPTELNHELIHLAQQRELLFLPFFLWYLAEWLWRLAKYRNWMQAYFHIRFEQEAYRHQTDPRYLQCRKHFQYLRENY